MSDTIFKQVNYSLGGLIQNIAMGQIGLPDLQRPFVWKNVKVRDLFDSMYRGYPVGHLLFWENGLTSSPRTIGSEEKQLPPSLVIVDGQQRLTSLYAVIKGAPVLRDNYRNEHIRIAFNPIEETFEVTSSAIERDRSFISDISKLWSEETGLFQLVHEYLDGLRASREVSAREVKAIEDSVGRLHSLLSFPFTVLQLSSDISEEDVAEVFVRVNSQGKTLNQSDFILTLMSVFCDDGRAELESFCRNARIPAVENSTPFNQYIEPSPDQLLRVGVGLAFRRARLEHVYSILRGKDLATGKFSEDGRVDQFETLKQAQAKVLNLQHWHSFLLCIRQSGYRSKRMINSQTALLYAYTLYLIGRTEYHVDEQILRRVTSQWFFMSAITGRYSGSPESTMDSDLAMLRNVTTVEEFTAKLRQACNIALPADFWEVTLPNELATSSAKSPSLFAFEAALVLSDAPALFSNIEVSEMLDPSLLGGHDAIDRRRLFPRNHLAKLGIAEVRDTNQIANYAYIGGPSDSFTEKESPSEYLPKLQESFGEAELARMYRFHALPAGWENLDYWAFLQQRRALMSDVIREAYKRLIEAEGQPPPALEPDLDELIERGESDKVEFKSTLRMNLHTGKEDKQMELAVLKTLAGFLNMAGGTLIIGVADDGNPLGLEADGFPDEDHFGLHLTNIVNDRVGPNVWLSMHANFDDYEDVRVLVVHCQASPSPVYVKDGAVECFYVRTGPATTALGARQTQIYIKQRFG